MVFESLCHNFGDILFAGSLVKGIILTLMKQRLPICNGDVNDVLYRVCMPLVELHFTVNLFRMNV